MYVISAIQAINVTQATFRRSFYLPNELSECKQTHEFRFDSSLLFMRRLNVYVLLN